MPLNFSCFSEIVQKSRTEGRWRAILLLINLLRSFGPWDTLEKLRQNNIHYVPKGDFYQQFSRRIKH